jgi:hypothetical protein
MVRRWLIIQAASRGSTERKPQLTAFVTAFVNTCATAFAMLIQMTISQGSANGLGFG